MEASLLSSELFDGVPAMIKGDVYSENQNKAVLQTMKSGVRAAGTGKAQPRKPARGGRAQSRAKTTPRADTVPASRKRPASSAKPETSKKPRVSFNKPRQYKR